MTAVIASPATEVTRERWLADRRKGIGASEWSTVLGINPRKSAFQLGLEKLGQIEPERFDGNEDIEYGFEMEEVTLRILAKRTGRVVQRWPSTMFVRSIEREFLGCTPDAIQHDPERGDGPAQTKNTNAYLMREWTGEAPPLIYQVQLQAELYVLDKPWGTLCATIGGNRFKWFDLERNDKFIAAALPLLEKFWKSIAAGEPPAADSSQSTTFALSRLYPVDTGLTIPLPDSFQKHYDELEALKHCQKALKNRRTSIENVVKETLGDNSVGTLPSGDSFSWKSQTQAEYTVPETTYRVLRQTNAKGKAKGLSQIFAEVTAALLAHGGTLYHESDSGSRYFELAGGLMIRVADHEANERTEAWMQNREVHGIRVDEAGWREQLEAVTGPLLIED